MNRIQTFAAKLLGIEPPATIARPSLSPRGEPANYSSGATVGTVQQAIRSAERGDTEPLFRLYRDSLLSDDHIQACFNTRKLAVLGQPLVFAPKNENNADDVAAAAAVTRAISDCENWTDGLGALLDSALWPVSVCEKLFMPAGEPGEDEPRLQWTLRRLEPVSPFLFCWRWAYQGNLSRYGTTGGSAVDMEKWEPLLKLWPLDATGTIQYRTDAAEPLDPYRHLVHRGHLLTGFKDNWGGPMRAVLFWWLLRGLGRDWFGRFMERYGNPFVKGRTNTQDPAAVSLLQDAFSMATKIGGIVIGQDDEIELVQATVQGGAEGHRLWHDVCNNAISRAITGYETTGGSSPAGMNAGQSMKAENVREDFRIFDQMKLGDTLKRQLIAHFLRINGLPGRVEVVWGGLSDADASSFSTTLQNLSNAGLEPTDDAIPTVNKKLGFSVQRKQAAPAPMFGVPPSGGPRSPFPSRDGSEVGSPRDSRFPSSEGSGVGAPEPEDDEEQIETLSTRDLHGRLLSFSAGGKAEHPSDRAVASRRAALAKAYAGSMAPFREAILSSGSKEECLQKLRVLYADWKPERLNAELETALQIAAASGAVAASRKSAAN